MKIHKNVEGYLLIYTLMCIGIAMGVISLALSRVTIMTGLSTTMIARAKARQIALGGITLAISQMTIPDEKKEEKAPEKKQAETAAEGDKKLPEKAAPSDPEKKFLQKLLVILNKWQTAALTEQHDGVKGKIQFYIACEDGKIDINQLYDFQKKKFFGEADKKPEGQETAPAEPTGPASPIVEKARAIKEQSPDGRKLLEAVLNGLRAKMGVTATVNDLEAFFKERKKPLDDVTQLLQLPGFAFFKNAIFAEPFLKEKKEKPLYLTDLFTITRISAPLDPWVLSDSVRAVVGISRAKQDQKISEEQLNKVKTQVNWAQEWDELVKPFYEKEFSGISKAVTPFFKNQFEPNTFSVLSYGTVGVVTVRYYAIIERMKTQGKDAKPKFIIRQLYQV